MCRSKIPVVKDWRVEQQWKEQVECYRRVVVPS